jgi:hypothetical protein
MDFPVIQGEEKMDKFNDGNQYHLLWNEWSG